MFGAPLAAAFANWIARDGWLSHSGANIPIKARRVALEIT